MLDDACLVSDMSGRPHPVVFRHVLSMMLVTGSDIGRDVLSQFLARSLRVMEHCILKLLKLRSVRRAMMVMANESTFFACGGVK